MLRFDHLAVSATTLEDGIATVENALGVALAGGGKHPHMATHNRLLALGDIYLEVISQDPSAPTPAWPRWFDLDQFQGSPRLTNWIVSCDDLMAELAQSPAGTGTAVSLERGDLRWRMAVPPDGKLPYDGCFPALISWQGALHPAAMLAEAGVRLERLEIAHPKADQLAGLLVRRMSDPRVIFLTGPTKQFRATFSTRNGLRYLD